MTKCRNVAKIETVLFSGASFSDGQLCFGRLHTNLADSPNIMVFKGTFQSEIILHIFTLGIFFTQNLQVTGECESYIKLYFDIFRSSLDFMYSLPDKILKPKFQ